MMDRLEKRLDDSEQYSRRVSLRIDNVPAPEDGEGENCIEKGVKIMEKMDCGLSASDIDRAHRVGPKKPVKVTYQTANDCNIYVIQAVYTHVQETEGSWYWC